MHRNIFSGVKYFCLTVLFPSCMMVVMDRRYEDSLLFDFYGDLLTERQRELFEEVVFGDLSYGEAAEEYEISRQGVHDMLRRTRRALAGYEEKLGLVRKFLILKKKTEEIRQLARDERIRQLAEEILEEL